MAAANVGDNESVVQVAPDRVLVVTTVGPPDGHPVLYFHGAGDCSLALPRDVSGLDRAGVTLHAIDRPGYGGSTRVPGRTLRDWAADVDHVADFLGLDRFGLLAWSAGTVHALACAAASPRVAACALYGAVAPPQMPGYETGLDDMTARCAAAARDNPEGLRAVMATLTADPVAFSLGLAAAEYPGKEPDPELTALLTAVAHRAFAQGSDAMVDDFELIYRDWGLALTDVRCPVLLTVGSDDAFTPPSWSRWLAANLADAEVAEVANRAHGDFLRPDVFDPLIDWLAKRSSGWAGSVVQ